MITDPEQLIPYVSAIDILEKTAADLGRPDFGLCLARKQSINILGPLAIIARNEETVFSAVHKIKKYMQYYSPAVNLTIESPTETAEPKVAVSFNILSRQNMRQAAELQVGRAVKIFKVLVNQSFHPVRVTFTHSRLLPLDHYIQYFGCPVEFNAEVNSLALTSDEMKSSIAGADPSIRMMMEGFLNQALEQSSLSFSQLIKDLVKENLPSRRSTISLIARQVSMSERSLQRRLKEEQSTFEIILDDVRKEIAWNCLTTQKMPMSDIATLLGYSEQSTFNRSCKRWFEQSPLQVRKANRQRA